MLSPVNNLMLNVGTEQKNELIFLQSTWLLLIFCPLVHQKNGLGSPPHSVDSQALGQ